MKSMILNRMRDLDYSLLIAILLLAGFGLIMVYSSSSTLAYLNYGTTDYFFIRQLRSLLLGLVLLFIFIPFQLYNKMSPLLVMLSIVLLILVLIPGIGVERNHSQRWIQVASFLFQPAEFIKLFILIYFASFYSKKRHLITQFRTRVLPPLFILAIVFLLIFSWLSTERKINSYKI